MTTTAAAMGFFGPSRRGTNETTNKHSGRIPADCSMGRTRLATSCLDSWPRVELSIRRHQKVGGMIARSLAHLDHKCDQSNGPVRGARYRCRRNMAATCSSPRKQVVLATWPTLNSCARAKTPDPDLVASDNNGPTGGGPESIAIRSAGHLLATRRAGRTARSISGRRFEQF